MYVLEFTPAQIVILDKALQALPYGQVAELYLSIKNQIEAQQKAVQEKVQEKETISAD